MKVVIDNFCVLAVEKCMLNDLADILSPDTVMRLGDDLVNAIAAESESSMLERQRTTEELKTLKEGLVLLNRFSPLRSAGDADEESVVTPDIGPPSNDGSEDRRVNENFPSKEYDTAPTQTEAVMEVAQEALPLPRVEAAAPLEELNNDFHRAFGSGSKLKKGKKKSKGIPVGIPDLSSSAGE
ncbi:MAG: hypothetical protein Q9166_006905 [cf. Caloplaca sp. 2 TL-2023]